MLKCLSNFPENLCQSSLCYLSNKHDFGEQSPSGSHVLLKTRKISTSTFHFYFKVLAKFDTVFAVGKPAE
jgi:hypothetical protein